MTVKKIDFKSCSFKDLFEYALLLAKRDKTEADQFYNSYVSFVMNENNSSREDAEKICKSNLGYFAGYYDKDTCDVIYNTYKCCHPIFGGNPFSVSPKEAFETGYELGKSSRR